MPIQISMYDALDSIMVLRAWLVFVLLISILDNLKLAKGDSTEHARRRLVDQTPGFISIDCGATNDYLDEGTGIFYKSDSGFIETGTKNPISPEYSSMVSPNYVRQMKNLRSFPQGTKNCYTLKPGQGKSSNYLIRAFFFYGNYETRFNLQSLTYTLGVIFGPRELYPPWETFPDIIHVPLSDTIFVCLINTGSGIPFISALELRPLSKSIYPTNFGALSFGSRLDIGTSSHMGLIRYEDDVYDRLWHSRSTLLNWVPINTSSVINTQDSNDSYQLPAQVLRTAVQPPSGHNALTYVSSYGTNNPCNGDKYYVCFHFAEIAKPTQGKKREFIIDVEGGNYTSEPITLEYLKPLSICPKMDNHLKEVLVFLLMQQRSLAFPHPQCI
ncbi:putative lrr receptor-like serine/threonine-protein kinase [Quercus suber]|uniref:Lrr receptor-like serine/threonine-protein kinase n=1 Tax=Quercus suber TaxID=58331 RepID=A0AAW0LEH3_QUESU